MKRGITINFSNKTFYTLIALALILIISAVVYAVGSGTVPNPGHAIEDLETCAAGQTLVTNAAGNGWECGAASGGSLSCASLVTTVGLTGNQLCSNLGSGYTCVSISAADMGSGTYGSSAATCEWLSTTVNYKARCCKVSGSTTASSSLTCQNVNGANTNGNALCTALGSGWKCTSTGNDKSNCETTFGSLVARCCNV